jgi:hypothetical protein
VQVSNGQLSLFSPVKGCTKKPVDIDDERTPRETTKYRYGLDDLDLEVVVTVGRIDGEDDMPWVFGLNLTTKDWGRYFGPVAKWGFRALSERHALIGALEYSVEELLGFARRQQVYLDDATTFRYWNEMMRRGIPYLRSVIEAERVIAYCEVARDNP